MGNECAKAVIRRLYRPEFHQRYFVGHGIDIGAGSDPLSKYQYLFPRIVAVDSWDWEQGDALEMRGAASGQFDFVSSHHCLEHIAEPWKALRRWVDITRIGGHVIVVVPDFEMYERSCWPSRFNQDHRCIFTLSILCENLPHINGVEIIKIEKLEGTFDQSTPGCVDQTLGVAECAIEFVLRRNGPT